VLALLGPNGGGKTTLLKTFLGLLKPKAGEVRLDDKPLNNYSIRERALIATPGYDFQEGQEGQRHKGGLTGGMPSKSPIPGLDFSPTPTEMCVSVFRNFKISPWIGFCFSQNQKMDGGGDAQERKDAGQKRGAYNSKHGRLGREYPHAYRSWYALRDRCNNPNNPPG
jgi:ABC transporter